MVNMEQEWADPTTLYLIGLDIGLGLGAFTGFGR